MAKKPYFMRLLAQTRRPETDTKRPEVDKLTKRLEISLRAISRGFESHSLRHKKKHSIVELNSHAVLFVLFTIFFTFYLLQLM